MRVMTGAQLLGMLLADEVQRGIAVGFIIGVIEGLIEGRLDASLKGFRLVKPFPDAAGAFIDAAPHLVPRFELPATPDMPALVELITDAIREVPRLQSQGAAATVAEILEVRFPGPGSRAPRGSRS
jgi:hypothetical protein